MATFLGELEKEVQIVHLQTYTYHLVQKIMKIGPVDPEIIGLRAIIKKKKDINASKIGIYSPVGKFAERAK